MRKQIFLILVLAGVVAAAPFDSRVLLNYVKAEVQASSVVISWESQREDGLLGYDVLRATRYSNGRQAVNTSIIQARGGGSAYRFTDDTLYKSASEEADYFIEFVFKDGTRQTSEKVTVNYTSTAARRTWGSIKAMFQ